MPSALAIRDLCEGCRNALSLRHAASSITMTACSKHAHAVIECFRHQDRCYSTFNVCCVIDNYRNVTSTNTDSRLTWRVCCFGMPGRPPSRWDKRDTVVLHKSALSSDGWSIQPMMSFSAPRFHSSVTASLTASGDSVLCTWVWREDDAVACLKRLEILKVAVEVGFVVGTIPQMTTCRLSGKDHHCLGCHLLQRLPHVFSSLYFVVDKFRCKWFLITYR